MRTTAYPRATCSASGAPPAFAHVLPLGPQALLAWARQAVNASIACYATPQPPFLLARSDAHDGCAHRYGFRGFYSRKDKPIVLTSSVVEGIQLQGGTILGTSRGGADMKEIVKRIDMWGLDMVFVVGGNGGNAGANAIHQMCERESVACAVIGIPKSIDNDILLVDRCAALFFFPHKIKCNILSSTKHAHLLLRARPVSSTEACRHTYTPCTAMRAVAPPAVSTDACHTRSKADATQPALIGRAWPQVLRLRHGGRGGAAGAAGGQD